MSTGFQETAPFPTGWTPNPAGVARIMATLPLPTFAAGAPHLMGFAAQDVKLYTAWKEVNGDKFPSYPAQEIGDCTSFGTGHGIDLLACVQIALSKRSEVWKEACTEALYGEGRELAHMLGSGDGCYGGAVGKAANQFGVTTREQVGPYSGQRAKQWGRTGTPAEVKAEGKDHLLQTISLVTTWDELQAALSNGYPVTVCSNQGFSMTRDSKGICRPSGHWAHCMLICGILYVGSQDECAVIANSWGDQAFSGPTPEGMPPFAFGAQKSVVERMLALEDSWALSSFQGFPGQPLPSSWTYGGFA